MQKNYNSSLHKRRYVPEDGIQSGKAARVANWKILS